jgi:hypothetical protein
MSILNFYLLSIAIYYLSLLILPLPLYLLPWTKALPAFILYCKIYKERRYYRILSVGIHRTIHNIFLLFSIGDLFLGYDYLSIWFFVLGMVPFAIAHSHLFYYLQALNSKNGKFNESSLNFLPGISLLLICLFPVLSFLVFPIVAYAFILSQIVKQTMINLKSYFHLACFIFVISDVFVLTELIFGYWGVALPIYWISLYFLAVNL